ncbi:hypothetical protein [Metabacillus iocasae]|uniref:Uncharacterized protein n=1 Tax=Priestia iocasae TaxID=2291674 RepID=A0ABS2QR49_9BACI|nr:hypothetical protein [Metabacillus iocasae]MBM7701442.1 hypothetical protein [Metabacillus iocasae]
MIKKFIVLLTGFVIILATIANIIEDGFTLKWLLVLVLTIATVGVLWMKTE